MPANQMSATTIIELDDIEVMCVAGDLSRAE